MVPKGHWMSRKQPKRKPSLDCPCGSGDKFNDCCGPLLRRQAEAETAEQLMRSRYSAFVKRNGGYLMYCWHPDSRPEKVGQLPTEGWAPLEILSTAAGGPDDDYGTVEFRTAYIHADHDHPVHEVARFERHEGRWVYAGGTAG